MSSLDIVIRCGWNCDQTDLIWLHYVLVVAFFLFIFYSIYFLRHYFFNHPKSLPEKPETEHSAVPAYSEDSLITPSQTVVGSSIQKKHKKSSMKKSTKYLFEAIGSVVLSGFIVLEGMTGGTGNGIFILILTFINYKIVAGFFLLLAYIFIRLYFDTKEIEKYD